MRKDYYMKEVIDLGVDGVQAEINTVSDTTTIFDGGRTRFSPVPGYPNEQFVPWGDDNRLPYTVRDLLSSDEVTAQNKLFNVLTCYGAGLRLLESDGQPARNSEILSWMRGQQLPRFFLEQVTDMKFYYFTVAVIILSKDGERINRIVHKDAASCRFGVADKYGRIRHVYYKDWEADRGGKPERIELLSETDPLGDLERRMGRADLPNGRKMLPTSVRKFAIVCRFPTVTNPYYPVPYYAAMFQGGSYDEKRLISMRKRAKLRNSSSIKYQVEIEKGYWERLFLAERLMTPEEQRARMNREKENIREFLLGALNSGKAWITQYLVDPNGKEVRDVRIYNLEGAKEGGDWNEELNAAANTLCYADNVHPNLVGATPGKSQMNNSGSDKRELFTMKQALETAFHDILLYPLQLVCDYNGWEGITPSVPMIQLTTLDEHKDAKPTSIQ